MSDAEYIARELKVFSTIIGDSNTRAYFIIKDLLDRYDDSDAISEQIIKGFLANLYRFAQQTPEAPAYAHGLLKLSIKNCRWRQDKDLETECLAAGWNALPAVINHSGFTANDLVELLINCTRHKYADVANKSGIAADGTIIAISAHGGAENRFSFATKTGKKITFVAGGRLSGIGCFRGNSKELLLRSNRQHGKGTQQDLHYKNFVVTATQLLAQEQHPVLSTLLSAQVEQVAVATLS